MQTNSRRAVDANVERIKQKYESGYDSGYDSDTKIEQSRVEHGLSITPSSKVNSVDVEYGIIGGC
ncbi:hypothetical protein [Wolbachia pipientis]|uniref:hypothetical protein n=1 Tax=Wolbachia pipientis TaxID=955 RepID=UPI0025A3E3A5|nr:hypothetical protein [Wolbachia pipientis]MDM8335044.1 hypothetical protein [Wolbachia pipientis]